MTAGFGPAQQRHEPAHMANFLDSIFARLQRSAARVVLREIHGAQFGSVTGSQLLEQVHQVRTYIRTLGLKPGDRCALLAPNSIRWAAFDLAVMAEGLIVVPLYSRQAPADCLGMMKDSQPRLLFVSDAELAENALKEWPRDAGAAPKAALMDDILRSPTVSQNLFEAPKPRKESDLVTIIYTSGTSGEPKGVCLSTANVTHMLKCTTQRLDQLMSGPHGPDRVFHWAPFNFAASWIMLLSCLSRESVLTLSTDLSRLPDEIRLSAPDYFLNVPTLLERVRRGVEEALAKRAAPVRAIFSRGRAAWERKRAKQSRAFDALWFWLGRKLIFSKVKKRFGPNLRALICGSAPLAPDTQEFFSMMGIPVLQAYGLTETTAICTMDDPSATLESGYVGWAIPGAEMRVAENQEIVVRGPNIFAGYWNRPEETARVMRDGWFHTGDQGEVNARGSWRIIGRIKNLIILNSGHNIAPEPIEENLARLLPGAPHVVLIGNGRGYLCALVAGGIDAAAVQSAIDAINPGLPHYRQIRAFTIIGEAFTADNGLLTAMGKLRRDAISARFAAEINSMYDRKRA
jgi:long-chain acyl-CoA synthetase